MDEEQKNEEALLELSDDVFDHDDIDAPIADVVDPLVVDDVLSTDDDEEYEDDVDHIDESLKDGLY